MAAQGPLRSVGGPQNGYQLLGFRIACSVPAADSGRPQPVDESDKLGCTVQRFIRAIPFFNAFLCRSTGFTRLTYGV